jgi:hypothetical protein
MSLFERAYAKNIAELDQSLASAREVIAYNTSQIRLKLEAGEAPARVFARFIGATLDDNPTIAQLVTMVAALSIMLAEKEISDDRD